LPRIYFGPQAPGVRPQLHSEFTKGGEAIAEVLRHAWSRLIRKQWLILYPFALSVASTLCFFALYATGDGPLTISAFFDVDFDRWLYVRDRFITGFSWNQGLLVPILAGVAFCGFAAYIQGAFLRAVVSPRYPLAPRRWLDVVRLFIFYLLLYAVTWVAPLPGPGDGVGALLVLTLLQVVWLMVTFADFVIVYESEGVMTGLRRSLRLVGLRLGTVIAIYLVLNLVVIGIMRLYALYFNGAARIFILLPLSRMLVESFVLLFANLVLVFLYEDLRRHSLS
jgi:hypothetical protein